MSSRSVWVCEDFHIATTSYGFHTVTRSVALLGAAAIPCGKWQSPANAAEQVLEHEVLANVVLDAVADAGVERKEIGSLSFAQCRPYTLQKYFATFMAHYLRLPCTGTVAEILGNGMTAGLAFEQAVNDILLGRTRVALALGVNFETATSAAEHMMSSMRATGDVDFQVPFGVTPIAWYAMDAARYIHDYGSSREEIATVAVKNRRHASLNPLAQFRKPVTLEQVLAQPMIVEPLGLYEVPPRSDGAVCLVLADEEVALATGRPYARIRSRGFYHEGAHQISEVPGDMTALIAAQRAGHMAYDIAGVQPSDIDFAELYAPCTIVEVLVSEALGLVPRGGGARCAAEGETSLGGRIPICTSGGLQSRGHPAYVTPFYSFVEALEQLRGKAANRQVADARLAVTSAELGNYNAALVHVLEAVR
ncbi:thiolase family protein [Roseomonas gilardii]|uniref:Thiolase family protein n=1 Tax=Roseomonas gilardii TaxID=257708 RepID=A0ABU3MM96_9PROT|nr:thiolase family protein [Roseomonas gilardii]MDT8333857.1 thiolase family protein [Roseomonas gilardii]